MARIAIDCVNVGMYTYDCGKMYILHLIDVVCSPNCPGSVLLQTNGSIIHDQSILDQYWNP